MINTFNFQIAIILSIIEKNGRKSEHIFSQTQYYIGMEYRIRKIYGTIDKFPSHLPPPLPPNISLVLQVLHLCPVCPAVPGPLTGS